MKQFIENLREQFINLTLTYSTDKLYAEDLWNELFIQYTSSDRYYHTLDHLASIFNLMKKYEDKLNNKEVVFFSVWFHDIIYDTNRMDNEELSAEFADRALCRLNISPSIISRITKMILVTKNHSLTNENDFDTKLFLDADLAILGSPRSEYITYKEGIRKEYKQYPDILYRAGRTKVLQQILDKDRIYKTDELRDELEKNARSNIISELKQLSI